MKYLSLRRRICIENVSLQLIPYTATIFIPETSEMENQKPATLKSSPRLIVADDEESMRYFLGKSLRRLGYEVAIVESGDRAIELYDARQFDLAVVDLKMPGADGIEVLFHIRSNDPEALVIIMTAYGTVRSAVEAMQKGAFNYITKPFEIDELKLLIERALEQRALVRENRELRHIIDTRKAYGGMVGQSPAMHAVYQAIDMIRDSSATVLITGESGTGKELVAQAIHIQSKRTRGAFVPINCAALPENLLENELFGHETGAFTGAIKRKHGLVERAHNGTLFLDEIAGMRLKSQTKVLRFLEERRFAPLGATEPIYVDLRVIAATNQDLEKMIEEGQFRQDLYWRIKVVCIHLPPLRERREDIPVLASYFLERFKKRQNATTLESFTMDAMIAMTSYPWPGNVRELESMVERMVVFHKDKRIIDIDDIPQVLRNKACACNQMSIRDDLKPYEKAFNTFELEYFTALLKRTKGNVSQAARLARISRQNLHHRIKQLDIDPNRFRS
ncbi:MAG: sigma-54 dependent transcriptional regulator [Planctomycetota bacterium]